MAYTPQHIANYYLRRAWSEGYELTALKLQKLVYITYGWFIALTDKPLFDEKIEAWRHGPVIQSLYHEFKRFGSDPIGDLASCYDFDSGDFTIPVISDTDKKLNRILGRVWETYKDYTGWQLRNITHEKDTPWAAVYRSGKQNVTLDDQTISSYYKKKIREYLDAAKKES